MSLVSIAVKVTSQAVTKRCGVNTLSLDNSACESRLHYLANGRTVDISGILHSSVIPTLNRVPLLLYQGTC